MARFCLALLAPAVLGATFGPITSLPGAPSPLPAMHAGYLTVDAVAGRALYGWFVESTSPTAATDPVVVWTNGGPGCSSLAGGLMSEQGPLRPNPDGSGNLVPNPWTWSQAANILFLESPAGVGFAYSNTTSDYTVGDLRTSTDNVAAILNFLQLYPRYASNRLFLSGESYSGHYTLVTARAIIASNAAGKNPLLNFRGFLVGNAWTDAALDNAGCLEHWYGHGALDAATRDGLLATCNMSDIGPLMAWTSSAQLHDERGVVDADLSLRGALGFVAKDGSSGAADKSCDDWQNAAFASLGNVDIYDLYSNKCLAGGAGAVASSAVAAAAPPPDSNVPSGGAAVYDPCVGSKVETYLNRADVQAAIHVVPSLIPGGRWVGCSSTISYSRFDLLTSMLPVYREVLASVEDGRFVVFSGDVDAIVPFTSTRAWIGVLNLTTVTPLHPWATPTGQVGGWSTTYIAPGGGPAGANATLHFVTVRNAGHMVPSTQPSRALQLFTAFLDGTTL